MLSLTTQLKYSRKKTDKIQSECSVIPYKYI